jgi:hypothetical protein
MVEELRYLRIEEFLSANIHPAGQYRDDTMLMGLKVLFLRNH